MFRLASILYSLIGTTLAGTAMVAVLTAGFDTLVPIVAAAAAGAVLKRFAFDLNRIGIHRPIFV